LKGIPRPRPVRSRFDSAVSATFIGLLHVPPVVACFTGTQPADWALFGAMYLTGGLAVTVGLHRYFAHRAFRTSRAFQAVLALGAASCFGNPLTFAGKHRLHHRLSDREGDVHSPRHGFWYCWFGSLWDDGHDDDELRRYAPDLACHPELRLLQRFFYVPALALGLASYALFGFSGFALGFCLSRVVILHAASAVNYFGHGHGYRRYETGDDSTNNALVALLSWGVGWHNNHHHYPPSARAGFFWWELDPSYWAIRILSWLGLVWDVREVPAWALATPAALAPAAALREYPTA
jgi:stearoyl-CoA desaturase (delta-9 desaturase)